MVSDAKHDWGGRWWKGNKIRVVEGGLLGTAGATTDCNKLIEWFRSDQTGKPPKNLEASALLLTEHGLFAVDADCGLTLIDQQFFAIGSGGDAALGAMMAGADPLTAAKIAAEIDSASAGPFYTMTLDQALESADENSAA